MRQPWEPGLPGDKNDQTTPRERATARPSVGVVEPSARRLLRAAAGACDGMATARLFPVRPLRTEERGSGGAVWAVACYALAPFSNIKDKKVV